MSTLPEGESTADLRRTEIVARARELFGDRGTTDVSMDEIAQFVGVARSTLYVYFSNRSDLMVACIEGLYTQLQVSMDGHPSTAPLERFEHLITGLLEVVDGQPAFFRLALTTQGSLGTTAAAVDVELGIIGAEVANQLTEILVDGQKHGLWKITNIEQSVTLLGQQIYGALLVRASQHAPLDAGESARHLVEFCCGGLAASLRVNNQP